MRLKLLFAALLGLSCFVPTITGALEMPSAPQPISDELAMQFIDAWTDHGSITLLEVLHHRDDAFLSHITETDESIDRFLSDPSGEMLRLIALPTAFTQKLNRNAPVVLEGSSCGNCKACADCNHDRADRTKECNEKKNTAIKQCGDTKIHAIDACASGYKTCKDGAQTALDNCIAEHKDEAPPVTPVIGPIPPITPPPIPPDPQIVPPKDPNTQVGATPCAIEFGLKKLACAGADVKCVASAWGSYIKCMVNAESINCDFPKCDCEALCSKGK